MSEIMRLFNNVKRAKPLDGTRAFGGSTSRKATAVALATAHRLADDFIQGTFWEEGVAYDQDGFVAYGQDGFKGCAVGCLTHTQDDPHQRLGDYYGIPRTLAHLVDDVFEALGEDDCKGFPLAFIKAIPVGADLRPVAAKLYLLIARKHASAEHVVSVPYFEAEVKVLGSGRLNDDNQDCFTQAYNAFVPNRVITDHIELKRDAPLLREELLRLVASA